MSEFHISKKNLFFLYIALSIVYLAGLFVPLMENDSAQHASMAMRMALTNDFLHIFKGGEPYLDKPHLHFWLSALSMKIFGINHVAYRIPALLFLVMGAYSTFKLTLRLYKNNFMAHMGALIFLSAQTIVLSGHDVRTDAVMTGAVIWGIYNLVAYIQSQKSLNAILGGLGAAMALSSKGMIGVGIIGLCILCYLAYSREWKRFFGWKALLGLLSFVLGIMPVLYAYYVQYDLHPEYVFHGRQNISGVRFILWDQSFNRFTGHEFAHSNPDYFFFFHNLLWLFIPFSLVLYSAVFSNTVFFVKTRFKKMPGHEFLTLGGFWTVMLIFSYSKFKLPHYLNSLAGVFSVLIAARFIALHQGNRIKETRFYLVFNYILMGVGMLLMAYLGIVAFPVQDYFGMALVLLMLFFLVRQIFTPQAPVKKLFYTGVLFAAMLNMFLNTQFYPQLTQYQAGLIVSKQVKALKINPQDIVMPDEYKHWTLDFYTATNLVRLPEEALYSQKGKYLFISRKDLQKMESNGLKCQEVCTADYYRITALTLKFLNPETRAQKLEPFVLVKID